LQKPLELSDIIPKTITKHKTTNFHEISTKYPKRPLTLRRVIYSASKYRTFSARFSSGSAIVPSPVFAFINDCEPRWHEKYKTQFLVVDLLSLALFVYSGYIFAQQIFHHVSGLEMFSFVFK
jgi:hypothetical protein